MNAAGYVLGLALLDRLPLNQRPVWLAWLAHLEPHPQDHRKAAQMLHECGLLIHHTLTPEGVQAAREALCLALTPPGSIGGAV
ncbi:hypothetical protein [Deinococcus sp.]|uniref:hypothetical protein n=1 Tax=Deinococcus sp. TaxID=47478 RepID=UPI0025E1419D|nr:hypothetical protein [Deinococcus sp.]